MSRSRFLLAVVLVLGAGQGRAQELVIDASEAARFVQLALECVHQEYPNKISHVMSSDRDALAPRQLTPAFYGCYDWHSSVHGHWLLARLARSFPQAPFSAEARRRLAISLTGEHIAAEVLYLSGSGRISFERPYGLAWLLQLAAELREWQAEPAAADGEADRPAAWSAALEPLEALAVERFSSWLVKLDYPIRTGEHSQTAFAFGLMLDWARVAAHEPFVALLERRVVDFYGKDTSCPLAYEPSGQDFLSPCLAEADLMRRVLPPAAYAGWLTRFLPGLSAATGEDWLPPARVSDRSDPKLAHLDGLNLSRAWMLEGIAAGLPQDDLRIALLTRAAATHASSALAAVTGEHYAGGHWLGSFATYLVTDRGQR